MIYEGFGPFSSTPMAETGTNLLAQVPTPRTSERLRRSERNSGDNSGSRLRPLLLAHQSSLSHHIHRSRHSASHSDGEEDGDQWKRNSWLRQSAPASFTGSVAPRSRVLSEHLVRLDETDVERWKKLFQVSVIGGKAIHLAEMMMSSLPSDAFSTCSGANQASVAAWRDSLPRYRLPYERQPLQVPKAACCTTLAYEAFIERLGIAKELRSILLDYAAQEEAHADASFAERLAHVRSVIAEDLHVPLPEELGQSLMQFLGSLDEEGGTVAVRSSSTMEDQSGASYAGQYDTYLNVPCEYDAVAQAIRRC